MPSELKKELEKELEILRSENQRLRGSYEAMEIEKNKWRVIVIFITYNISQIFRNLQSLTVPSLAVWELKL